MSSNLTSSDLTTKYRRVLTTYDVVATRLHTEFSKTTTEFCRCSDSTDIPVCLAKNGKRHKTMKGLAAWAYSAKGWYYGLKMLITTDLKR
ncbi:MAG TPA: transposase, partial [Candidatus Paceibacterota bacterium]